MKTRVPRLLHAGIVVAAVFALIAAGLMSCSKNNGVLTEIVLTPASPAMAPGYSLQLMAQGVLSDGVTYYMTTLTWNSSNPAIATVDANGLVTAGSGTGKVTITAMENDSHKNITGSLDLEVASIQSIAILPPGPTMAVSTAFQYHAVATLLLSDGTTTATQDLTTCITSSLTWTTSPPDVISTVTSSPGVAGSGVVTAGAVSGQVFITAIDLKSNVSGSTLLTVTSTSLAAIVVSYDDLTIQKMTPGASRQLIAKGIYGDNSRLDRTASMTWLSSNPDLATMSSVTAGLVSTVTATGSVTITATDPITLKAGKMVLTIE